MFLMGFFKLLIRMRLLYDKLGLLAMLKTLLKKPNSSFGFNMDKCEDVFKLNQYSDI